MGGEPKRWTADEVRAACERGERDFRGDDLSGLDLRGTDLRGAGLRGTNLKGACLAECRLGPRPHWWAARQGIGIVAGVAAGLALAAAGVFGTAALTGAEDSTALRLFVGLSLFAFPLSLARRGFGVMTVVVTAASAAGAAVAGAGTASGVIAGVVFGVIAVASAGAVAGAVAGAIAAAAAVVAVVASAENVAAAVGIGVAAAVALTLSFDSRRRALAGDPRNAWLRALALWPPGLGGACFAGADLTDADLSGAQTGGADLRGARLVRTLFRETRELHLARFDGPLRLVPLQRLTSGLSAPSADLVGQDFSGLALDGADLRGANLRGALLKEARLVGAQLDQACLEHADLGGADLRGASVQGAALRGARVDILTFLRSGWTADDLANLCDQGVEILGLETFPEPVQARILGEREGLTLYFSTRLTSFDKVLVDGVIVGVLGRDTRCHFEYRVQGEAVLVRLFDAPREDLERVAEALHLRVSEQIQVEQEGLTLYFSTRLTSFDKMLVDGVIVGVLGRDTRCQSEYREQGETATVRLFDVPREDLVHVAEALHLKAWKQAQVEQKALLRMPGPLQPTELQEGLSDLMEQRLARIELREASSEVGPATLRWCWEAPTRHGADRLITPHVRRLFLTYAPRNRELAEELAGHLQPLVRQELVERIELREAPSEVGPAILRWHSEAPVSGGEETRESGGAAAPPHFGAENREGRPPSQPLAASAHADTLSSSYLVRQELVERIELREAPSEAGPATLRWRSEAPTRHGADRLITPRPWRLFLIYAPRDRELAEELAAHLQPLVRQELVDPFNDARLLPGDDKDKVVSAHLESADAFVVLVSAALFQEGPWDEQLTRAMARQENGVRVIPVLARAVSWEGTELAQLGPLPEEGRPIVSWRDRDEAWACVVSGLRRVLLNQACG
jgi:uncharacterized protein YjbI with pentapeptide repeats